MGGEELISSRLHQEAREARATLRHAGGIRVPVPCCEEARQSGRQARQGAPRPILSATLPFAFEWSTLAETRAWSSLDTAAADSDGDLQVARHLVRVEAGGKALQICAPDASRVGHWCHSES